MWTHCEISTCQKEVSDLKLTSELRFYKTTQRSCSRNKIYERIQIQGKSKGTTNCSHHGDTASVCLYKTSHLDQYVTMKHLYLCNDTDGSSYDMIQHWMAWQLVNYKRDRMWHEVVMAEFKVPSQNLLGVSKENYENLTTVSAPLRFKLEVPQKTSPKCYR
jgi:hypothetical protein